MIIPREKAFKFLGIDGTSAMDPAALCGLVHYWANCEKDPSQVNVALDALNRISDQPFTPSTEPVEDEGGDNAIDTTTLETVLEIALRRNRVDIFKSA